MNAQAQLLLPNRLEAQNIWIQALLEVIWIGRNTLACSDVFLHYYMTLLYLQWRPPHQVISQRKKTRYSENLQKFVLKIETGKKFVGVASFRCNFLSSLFGTLGIRRLSTFWRKTFSLTTVLPFVSYLYLSLLHNDWMVLRSFPAATNYALQEPTITPCSVSVNSVSKWALAELHDGLNDHV